MADDVSENPYLAPEAEHLRTSDGWGDATRGLPGESGVAHGVGGKLAQAFGLLFGNLPQLAAVALTVWLPLNIGIEWLAWDQADPERFGRQLTNLADAIFGPLVSAGALAILAGRMQGDRVSYGDAMRTALATWPRLWAARFVAWVLIFLGFLALVVPGILAAIYFSLLDPAVVLEGEGIGASRRRSRELVRGRAWSILTGAVAFFVMLIGSVIALGAVAVAFEPLQSFWGSVAMTCLVNVLTLYLTCLLFLFYWEARHENPSDIEFLPGAKPEPDPDEL